ncbi:hypothetical protein ACF06O_25640 [Streptomyces albidoflavus]
MLLANLEVRGEGGQRHFGDELVDRPAHGVREVIDGALTEPFDAYVRREFGPLIRKASAEG